MNPILANPKALALLDDLWECDTHHAVIARRLAGIIGTYPTSAEIREAATRYQPKPANEMPAPVPNTSRDDARRLIEWKRIEAARAAIPKDNKIRRIAPGTYPAKRFSMIGGRVA